MIYPTIQPELLALEKILREPLGEHEWEYTIVGDLGHKPCGCALHVAWSHGLIDKDTVLSCSYAWSRHFGLTLSEARQIFVYAEELVGKNSYSEITPTDVADAIAITIANRSNPHG